MPRNEMLVRKLGATALQQELMDLDLQIAHTPAIPRGSLFQYDIPFVVQYSTL